MRLNVTVTDNFGQVDTHATRTGTNRWEAHRINNSWKCGISLPYSKIDGVGKYEAVFEMTGQSPKKDVMIQTSACQDRDLWSLYAQRRAYDTSFYPSITSKQYNEKIAEGFTETYGLIGKTLKDDLYNGKRKLSVGMERYYNPVMTTYAASVDIRDQETHPAWSYSGPIGHVFTKQYSGTIPLYRAYGEYNPSDWEVGITTDYSYYLNIIYGSGWTPLGTPGLPQGVLGYVCPAN